MSFFYKKAYLATAVKYERKMFMTLSPGRFRSFSNVVQIEMWRKSPAVNVIKRFFLILLSELNKTGKVMLG